MMNIIKLHHHSSSSPAKTAMVFIAVALISMLASCSKEPDGPDDPADNPSDDPKQELVIVPTWEIPSYSVTKVNNYTKAELIDHAIGSYGALMPASNLSSFKNLLGYAVTDQYVYHEAVINYSSVDHTGNPIDLSGIVCYKSDTDGTIIEQMVVDNHATITDNASAPSLAGSITQLLMLSSKSAIIAGDYQGYGVSKDAIHPYLNKDLSARQQIDMLKVAIDYLSNLKNTSLSAKTETYNVGYSQGGAVALAVHQTIESNDPDLAKAIAFKGSICGDGPYDLMQTFNAYVLQSTISIPVILPMIVRGMMISYPEIFAGLSLEDFFTPQFLTVGDGLINLLDQKQLNPIEYNVLMGAENPLEASFPLTDILSPDALAPDSKALHAMAAAFLRNNCIRGWLPKAPVTFFHSPDDTLVPYANLDDTSVWPSECYKITKPSKPGVDHLAGALEFYTSLLLRGPSKML